MPMVQARRESTGVDQAYEDLIRLFQKDFPTLRIIDGRHAGYGREAHCDFIHLNREGALAFSTAIGTILQQSLQQPTLKDRWVALPRYFLEKRDFGVEDLEQSGLAISRVNGVRR
jgi:hypothetical protein